MGATSADELDSSSYRTCRQNLDELDVEEGGEKNAFSAHLLVYS